MMMVQKLVMMEVGAMQAPVIVVLQMLPKILITKMPHTVELACSMQHIDDPVALPTCTYKG